MTSTKSSRKGDALAQFWQIYCWQLRKTRILSVVYAALTLLCFTVLYLCRSVGLHQSYFGGAGDWEGMTKQQLADNFTGEMVHTLNQQFYLVLIPLSLIFMVVFCVTAFGYMHKRRSVDLFHALPIRRTPMLLGNLAAGCTILLLVVTVNNLLCGVIAFAMDVNSPFTLSWLLSGIGYQLLLLAAAMVLTLFLLVASGTMVNAVLSGILLSLSWPVLCYCGARIIQMTLPGSAMTVAPAVATAAVPYLAVFVPFLNSDEVNLLSGGMDSTSYTTDSAMSQVETGFGITPWMVVWWCGVTVLLLAASIVIYRKRKSECAENNFSFPILRTVIRFLVSAAFGLGCGVIFGQTLNQNWAFFLAVLIGSALAHVVTQIIWVKGLREFRKSLPAYGVLMASLCAFFVALCTGGLGYVTRIPTVQNVEQVTLQLPSYHYDDSAQTYLAENAQMSVSTVEGEFYTDVTPKLQEQVSVKTVEELHQALVDRSEAPYLPCHEQYYNSCMIHYALSNGRTMERVYQLPSSEMDQVDETEGAAGQQEPPCDAATLEKLAAVVALDEYQACSMYEYQTWDQVRDVTSNKTTEKGETVGESGTLTKAQQKKIWATFRKELESDYFAYTEQESFGNTDETASEGQSGTRYYIDTESNWSGANWSDRLYRVLQKNADVSLKDQDRNQLELSSDSGGTYFVPASCQKTCALIKSYIGDNLQFTAYDEE